MAERGRSQLIKPLLAVSSMRSSRPGLHMDSKSKRPIGATQRPLSSLLRVQRKPSTPEDLSVSRARAKLWLLTSVISAVVLLHVLAGVRVSPGSGLASLTSDERQLTIYGEPKPGRTILDNILATYNLLFTNKPVVVEPTTKHTASVIFCHGVTNTAAMWQFAAQELAPYLPHVRWVLPNAPRAPLTMLNGTISYSWFDIAAKGEAAGEWPIPEDEAGMMKAAATIDNLIAAEVRRGVPASRVVVAGFSQGAILTLLVGLTNPRPLAGMISLGGYLPMKQSMHSVGSVLPTGRG
ncbi:uncharacterized protein L969DRAFT_54256 [Mixia osmundae IAM 14324]|uniref:Acyl-protein thioesterase 1 n=1 Tax=Mixia osmundae (strain CBS 9802 / IAM 14324 / JCM 22182 / KY 12970) TaxID=764103 RepID=G7E246_MIXOS|nr:uncharacterized protein L969DRAFT_54256 [Mixia osmundae IAM 14324]KEI36778.1 hypothetical protein L969DRAFT_54256 [Mixia osmundae IAM 14324]GAA96906.1 hypothetical protein E5Q_03580 [Mixia osmundae IAM 14324]